MSFHTFYSGSVPLLPASAPPVFVDIFSQDSVREVLSSTLFVPPPTVAPFTVTGLIDPTNYVVPEPGATPELVEAQWALHTLHPNAPTGFYEFKILRAQYRFIVSGSVAPLLTPASRGPWNIMRSDDFSNFRGGVNISYGPWLRLNKDSDFLIRIGEPAFREQGFNNAAEAEAASVGATTFFWHPGGPIEGAFDDDFFEDNLGFLDYELTYIPSLLGSGRWSIPWASNPEPKQPVIKPGDEISSSPELLNIWPGHFILRYSVVAPDGSRRIQDFDIRVWGAEPRRGDSAWVIHNSPRGSGQQSRDEQREPAFKGENSHTPEVPERFPVKPPQPRIPEQPGTPAVNRDKLWNKDTYSGQFPERPEDDEVRYRRPKKLGDAEAF